MLWLRLRRELRRRRGTCLSCVVRCPWQMFAPPQPSCASTVEALLEALRTWAGAEARDVRQHASARVPAADYAKDLDRWARGINDKHKIPVISAHLFRKGEAARPGHGERLRAIVALYRREYKAIERGIVWRKGEAASEDEAASEGETGGMPLAVRCCGVDNVPCDPDASELRALAAIGCGGRGRGHRSPPAAMRCWVPCAIGWQLRSVPGRLPLQLSWRRAGPARTLSGLMGGRDLCTRSQG